ncbi:MAG: peptidase S8 and S53 subtilisin kexin sedolisin [candidate division Kazan bacterium GW2011_GWA1_50_15]|uniref:Peptidase S8/S53 domain-containing protein n=2 Tax=Bacteria division Kazan-3B-28 TaxID=1798534 RepID=A0A0G1X840_UNCK3|nr:MAG: peptidase S8 and S53 subtilisin kexin sedolisin [candidate division Kazan bacterium GW2011_GWA1_50_15]KKW25840.1 MAG: hypothetical protein VE99_C0001G0479 [candidate division Kazan bacterium GW2011_GWC1_52_13]KKW27146.1 MAG: hypothetical protein VF00_C0001G0081 [candidate division Kazan bacterium GW2011_GWB1_52_7]
MRKLVASVLSALVAGWITSPAVASLPLQVTGWRVDTVSSNLTIQAAANDIFFAQQWYLSKIGIDRAWDTTTGSDLVIAVVDTGVDLNHADLAGKFWTNSDEIPNNSIDDDHNGYVDDYLGYDFVDRDATPQDLHGHGTGIASIIAARSNNGIGITGINWQARIMALRALNSIGGGDFETVATAIRYATDNGARVINMSFGSFTDMSVLASAINYAISHSVVIVAAVGNNSAGTIYYPAAYPQVIAVSSLNSADQLSTFSNYGPGVDVAAPGERIAMADLSSSAPSIYAEGSGSSFAAAIVTGTVSLMLARNPSLSPAQIETILKLTADNLNDPARFGAGRVNASRAVAYQPPAVRSSALVSGSPAAADGVQTVTISATITDGGSMPVQATINGTNNIVNGQLIAFGQPVSIGAADSSGRISFTLSSTAAATKQITLLNTTTGAPLVTTQAIFVPLGSPRYSMAWVKQSPYLTLGLNETATVWVEVKNTGNITWVSDGDSATPQGQIRLGTDRSMDRSSAFSHPSWVNNNRAARMSPNIVYPEGIARFSFTAKASQTGSFKEYFRPVIEYVTWLNDLGIYWEFNVTASGAVTPSGESSPTQAATDPAAYVALMQSKSQNPTLHPGEIGTLEFSFRNIGSALWLGQGLGTQGTAAVRVGTANPRDRSSVFFTPSWLSPNRALNTALDVPPNANLEVSFPIKAPSRPGVYKENFQLVAEYITWFGPVFGWTITVQ